MRSPRSSKHSWGAQFFAKDIAKRIVTLFGSGLTDREQLKNTLLAMFPPSEEDGRLLRLGLTATGRHLRRCASPLEAVEYTRNLPFELAF